MTYSVENNVLPISLSDFIFKDHHMCQSFFVQFIYYNKFHDV